MLRHEKAELLDGSAAVGEQAFAERGVDPSPGDHARAVLWDPFLCSKVVQLLHRFCRLHASLIEHRLDCIHAPLHGSRAPNDGVLTRHVHRSLAYSGLQRADYYCSCHCTAIIRPVTRAAALRW